MIGRFWLESAKSGWNTSSRSVEDLHDLLSRNSTCLSLNILVGHLWRIAESVIRSSISGGGAFQGMMVSAPVGILAAIGWFLSINRQG